MFSFTPWCRFGFWGAWCNGLRTQGMLWGWWLGATAHRCLTKVKFRVFVFFNIFFYTFKQQGFGVCQGRLSCCQVDVCSCLGCRPHNLVCGLRAFKGCDIGIFSRADKSPEHLWFSAGRNCDNVMKSPFPSLLDVNVFVFEKTLWWKSLKCTLVCLLRQFLIW